MKSIEKARQIIRNYQIGANVSHEDRDSLFELIAFEKIARYKWIVNQNFELKVMNTSIGKIKVKCINIVTTDGKRIPLTLKSLSPLASKGRTDKLKVLRNIVDYQIQEFRENHKKKIVACLKSDDGEGLKALTHCPYTGKNLKRGTSHIHHARIPFVDLVELWCKHTGTPLEGISTHGIAALRDKKLENSWKKFHEQNAVLEVVSKEYNLSQGRKPD